MFISPSDLKNLNLSIMPNKVVNSNPGKSVQEGHILPSYNDDWYAEAIKPYEGSSFYDTLKANPWLVSNNAAFSPSFGVKIAEAFGDYSARDQYYGDLRSKANQYLSEQLEAKRQQEYNSAPSQLEQARLAGSNPDLHGGVEPGSASENDQPLVAPSGMPGAGNGPGEVLSQFASLSMSAYSFASGFAKDMFSFKQMSNALQSEDLEIFDSLRSSVRDFIRDSAVRPHYDDSKGSWDIGEPDGKLAEAFAKDAFRSRKLRKLFVDEYYRSYSSARNELARITDVNASEEAVKLLNFSIANNTAYGYSYNNGPSSPVQQPMVIIAEELQNLRKDLLKLSTQYDFDLAGYNDEFVSGLDAGAASSAVNEGNKASSAASKNAQIKAKVDKVVNENLERIISRLEKAASEPGLPGILAQGML